MTVVTHRIAIMRKALWLLVSSIILVGCQRHVVFTEFANLPTDGWEADSTVLFHPIMEDSMADYQMLITIRHTDKYVYQNMWMFVDVMQDSVLLRRDTIEAQMANARGEWYGKGMSEYTLPLLYLERIPLSAGEYTIGIQQGMREESLLGITSVGLKFLKL